MSIKSKAGLSVTILVFAMAIVGCSSSYNNYGPDSAGQTPDLEPLQSLVVFYSENGDTEEVLYSVDCLTTEDSEDLEKCSQAEQLVNDEFFYETDELEACTEIYGGPQTATLLYEITENSYEKSLSRVNGCEIDDWTQAGVILPQDVNPDVEPHTPEEPTDTPSLDPELEENPAQENETEPTVSPSE